MKLFRAKYKVYEDGTITPRHSDEPVKEQDDGYLHIIGTRFRRANIVAELYLGRSDNRKVWFRDGDPSNCSVANIYMNNKPNRNSRWLRRYDMLYAAANGLTQGFLKNYYINSTRYPELIEKYMNKDLITELRGPWEPFRGTPRWDTTHPVKSHPNAYMITPKGVLHKKHPDAQNIAWKLFGGQIFYRMPVCTTELSISRWVKGAVMVVECYGNHPAGDAWTGFAREWNRTWDVEYIDGDPMNLWYENLKVVKLEYHNRDGFTAAEYEELSQVAVKMKKVSGIKYGNSII